MSIARPTHRSVNPERTSLVLLSYYLETLLRYYMEASASAEVRCLHSPGLCADGTCLACEADRVAAELRAANPRMAIVASTARRPSSP